MKKINYLTLMFFVIRSCFIGMSLNTLLYFSKNSSYISIIIGTIIGICLLILFDYISRLYPDKNLYEIIDCSFKKSIANILKFIILIFTFFMSFIIFWNLLTFISSQFLYKTPNIIIAICFMIAIIYTCFKGYDTYIRSTTIIFTFTIILFFISLISLTMQSDITKSFPLSISDSITGSYFFTGFNILPLFLLLNIPRNKIKDNDNFLKHKIYTLIFSSFTLFSVTYLVLTIYGIKLASLLQFPEFHLLKNISIFGFIERMENILALQWIFDYYVILTFLVLFIGDYTKPNKINYVIIGIIIVIISVLIFSSNTVGDTFIKHKLSHMIYFVYFFIPLLIAIKNKLQM